MTNEKVSDPRSEIDAIDSELLRLLNRRAEIALRVGEAKAAVDTSLCDPRREREVLARLRDENPGPFDEQSIENIFQRIIDESLHLQQRTLRPVLHNTSCETPAVYRSTRSRVAVLGDRGSFSEEAAMRLLGENCDTISSPTFDDLFGAIDRHRADYILSPLENTLVGSIHRCYELLLASTLHIVAEVELPVAHFLIACPEADFETIRTVESHPAALDQCRRFFAAHPHLQRVAGDDTASSVRRAVESGDVTRAGIGGRRTAEIYGGRILREHLEDQTENFTRFALLSAEPLSSTTGNKISLVVRLRHQPGSLHYALRPFVRRGIDLLKIESRPIRDVPGQFDFHLDLRAPASESELRGALNEVREQAEHVRYLGRYSTVRVTTQQ